MIKQPVTINKETLLICIDRAIERCTKKIEESEKTIWNLRASIETLPVKMLPVYVRDWKSLWRPRKSYEYDSNLWERTDKKEDIKHAETFIIDQVEDIATLNRLKDRSNPEKGRTPIPVFSNEITALGDSFPPLLAFRDV